ncbi:Hpt domain-containing protein [Nisaea sp.]|uniref:Hpt domain-containing protein n=1 Tax=Nisaea sp. TaxID=2024842 RepID=UPI0032EC6D7B
MTDSTLRQAFLSLREEFIEITRRRIEDIKGNFLMINSGIEADKFVEALHVVKREAHTIAGASGTYGYADVSKSANVLETFCSEIIDAKAGALDSAQRKEFEEAVDCLLADSDRMFVDPEIGVIPF